MELLSKAAEDGGALPVLGERAQAHGQARGSFSPIRRCFTAAKNPSGPARGVCSSLPRPRSHRAKRGLSAKSPSPARPARREPGWPP